MSRSQPQQARGFEFIPQQPQQQPTGRQLQGNVPPLTFSPHGQGIPAAGPGGSQFIASPRLPVNAVPPQQTGSTSLYAESGQFAVENRGRSGGQPMFDNESEELRRELEKSKAQIAQLEKTLKWWSDCTANWREKWNKEKTERRRLKDELGQLKSAYNQSLNEEIDRIKREFEEDHRAGIEIGSRGSRGTLPKSMERSGVFSTESTANFELQELLAETSSALENEKSENVELKSEVERLSNEQNDLKNEINVLKETISNLGGDSKPVSKQQQQLEDSFLPAAAKELIDSLQDKVEKLEKETSLKQTERLNDWSIIDRLESDRAILRVENEKLAHKVAELEKSLFSGDAEVDESLGEARKKVKINCSQIRVKYFQLNILLGK